MPSDSAPSASRPEPRPAQDWRALLAIYSITALIESTGVSQVFAFLPLRLRQIGLPDAEVASFTGIFTAMIFVFGIFLVPFWGVWADKFSRRAVIVRSALVEMVVFAGVALAREPWQLAVALLLTGLQLGNTGVMLAALRDVSPTHRIGTVSAAFGATGPIGFALGPIVGGFIVDGLHLPLTSVFWLGSVLSAAAVVLLLAASRDIRPPTVPVGRSLDLAASAVRSAVSDAQVRGLFLIFGVAILGSLMARPYLPILVERLVGTGAGLASAIGLVVGTAGLVGALASPGAGPLGDRLGLRRVLVGTLLIGGISVAVMPAAPQRGHAHGGRSGIRGDQCRGAGDGLRTRGGGDTPGAAVGDAQSRAASALRGRNHRAGIGGGCRRNRWRPADLPDCRRRHGGQRIGGGCGRGAERGSSGQRAVELHGARRN